MAKISEFLKKKQDKKASTKAPEKEYGTGMVIELPDNFSIPGKNAPQLKTAIDKFITSIGQNPEGTGLVVPGKVVLSFDDKAPVGSNVEVKIAPDRQTRTVVSDLVMGLVEKGSHLALEGAHVCEPGKVETRWANMATPGRREVISGLAAMPKVSWPGTDGKNRKVAIEDLTDEMAKDLENAVGDPKRASKIRYTRTFFQPESAVAVQTGDTEILAKKVAESGVSVGNTYLLRLFSKEGQSVASVQGFVGQVKDEKGSWVPQSLTDSLNKAMNYVNKDKLEGLSNASDLTMEIIPGTDYTTVFNADAQSTQNRTMSIVKNLLSMHQKESFEKYASVHSGFRSTIGILMTPIEGSTREPMLYNSIRGGNEIYKNRDMIRTPNFEGFTASNEAEQTVDQGSSQEVEEEEEAAVGPGM